MKPILLLLPVLCLAACAGQQPTGTTTSSVEATASLPAEDDAREPSHVHSYIVNDYIDPNNPRILHQGHPVDVVEQDEKWNLNSGEVSEGNYGPVATAADPNAAPNPYSAEFETELAQQRDQYRQLAALGTQMTLEMSRLQDMAQKEADAVSENASFRNRLDGLQHEIDELRPQPTAPNAPKKPSWLDPLWDLFRQVPDGKPVTNDKPTLQTNLVLRPLPPVDEAPVPTTNDAPSPVLPPTNIPPMAPVTSTNAPDAKPGTPSIPSPGEMAQPETDSTTP